MRYEAFLAEAAARDPQHTAIICGEERTSYTSLNEQAGHFAAALVAVADLTDGERCLIFADNSLAVAVGIFGTLCAGGVFSVINPTTKADKLAYLLNDSDAAVLLTQAGLLPVALQAMAAAPALRQVVVDDAAAVQLPASAMDYAQFMQRGAQAPPATQVGIEEDLAMLVYTSGSTGEPKGVMMTHRNMGFAARSITEYLQARRDDVVLSVLPLAFDYGLYQLLMCVMMGATLVLERSFAFPQKVLPLLAREQVTGFPLVPTMAAMLLQLRRLDPDWARSVRYLTNTAAALPPAHIAQLQQLFPQAQIYSMYGVTESKRCTWLPPQELVRRPDSVGIAIPGTQVWVVDEQGQRAPTNQVGELVVRGGHVMKGYWRNPQASDAVLRPGRYPWERVLHTGDLFRIDDEGFCYFVGRKDDIIKSRGEKVSPKEIENVLYALPGVVAAAVVGVPHEVLGRSLRAIIAVAEDVSLEARAVIAHCRANLEEFMVPREVEFRADLPRTNTGKIRRAELQAEVDGRPLAADND